MPINKDLLEILACPRCKGPIQPASDPDSLICGRCRLRYPVRDDIPVMLDEEATPLDENRAGN